MMASIKGNIFSGLYVFGKHIMKYLLSLFVFRFVDNKLLSSCMGAGLTSVLFEVIFKFNDVTLESSLAYMIRGCLKSLIFKLNSPTHMIGALTEVFGEFTGEWIKSNIIIRRAI